MVFKRKDSFFLDLGSKGARPAQVMIAEEEPAVEEGAAEAAQPLTLTLGTSAAATASSAAPGAPSPSAPSPAADPAAPVLTTAEAIAAELRAAQEAKPAPTLSTFAPDALNPGNGVPQRRRSAGANLAGFKAMAKSMTGK